VTDEKLKTIKILVVDDDPFVIDMLAVILESSDYSIDTAVNGIEALQKYSADSDIGLIVSDMNMPEMNGLELIKELRNNNADVPIIILTGNDEVAVAIEAMNCGANDYLVKDENIQDTILLSVGKVLEKHELKKKNLQLMAELAQKNSELETSNKELLELNNLKNKFLGIAAHDLRNPLVSIRGFSEIILSEAVGPLTEEQKEYLTITYTAAEGMLTLVNDLLDVSVIESGKIELQLTRGSLKKIIKERIHIHSIVAGRKDISLHAEYSECPDLLFDPNRISQVIDNLISNAIKFSPSGSNIYITIEKDENMAKVGVRDEGPGIPAEDQANLFVEFQKSSVQPTGGEKSTGLGLAIVKKMVEAHKGMLDVKSRVGSGSTFSFKIPMGE